MKTKQGRTVNNKEFPKLVFDMLITKTERISRLNKEHEMLKLLESKGLIEKHWCDYWSRDIMLKMLAIIKA